MQTDLKRGLRYGLVAAGLVALIGAAIGPVVQIRTTAFNFFILAAILLAGFTIGITLLGMLDPVLNRRWLRVLATVAAFLPMNLAAVWLAVAMPLDLIERLAGVLGGSASVAVWSANWYAVMDAPDEPAV